MNSEKYRIFSQNEFILLLLLSGGEHCTVGMRDEDADRGELAAALTELFSRGLVRREGDGFIPEGDGTLFLEISASKYAALFSSDAGRAASAYAGHDGIWVCEFIREGVRVKKWDRQGLARWLCDAGFLEKPFLRDEDAAALKWPGAPALPEGDRMFRLERYVNGGALTCRIEVVRGSPAPAVRYMTADGERDEPYTEEALERMMDAAFGAAQGIAP